MNKNTLIIIGLVIVIIALLAGLGFSMMAPAKEDVKLTILNNDTINEGDSVEIKLTDANDTPIAGQTVNIAVADENGTCENYSVVTNEEGIGGVALNKSGGTYTVNCTFAGNEKYAGSVVSKKITVEKISSAEQVSSSSTATQSKYASGLSDSEIEAYIQRDLDERAKNGVQGKYDYQQAREFYENVPPTGMA